MFIQDDYEYIEDKPSWIVRFRQYFPQITLQKSLSSICLTLFGCGLLICIAYAGLRPPSAPLHLHSSTTTPNLVPSQSSTNSYYSIYSSVYEDLSAPTAAINNTHTIDYPISDIEIESLAFSPQHSTDPSSPPLKPKHFPSTPSLLDSSLSNSNIYPSYISEEEARKLDKLWTKQLDALRARQTPAPKRTPEPTTTREATLAASSSSSSTPSSTSPSQSSPSPSKSNENKSLRTTSTSEKSINSAPSPFMESDSNFEYGFIIEATTTTTQLHVYHWPHRYQVLSLMHQSKHRATPKSSRFQRMQNREQEKSAQSSGESQNTAKIASAQGFSSLFNSFSMGSSEFNGFLDPKLRLRSSYSLTPPITHPLSRIGWTHRAQTPIGDIGLLKSSEAQLVLKELLEFANQILKSRGENTFSRKNTFPIYFIGSESVRMLPPRSQAQLLKLVNQVLLKSGFLYRPEFSRVMSGEEEAAYGWAAVQALNIDNMREDRVSRYNNAIQLGKQSANRRILGGDSPKYAQTSNVLINVDQPENNLNPSSNTGTTVNQPAKESETNPDKILVKIPADSSSSSSSSQLVSTEQQQKHPSSSPSSSSSSSSSVYYVGSIFMGASNLYISFKPDSQAPILENSYAVRLGSKTHHLYAHNYPFYGWSAAFDRAGQLLLEDWLKQWENNEVHPNSHSSKSKKHQNTRNEDFSKQKDDLMITLPDPCLPFGYSELLTPQMHIPTALKGATIVRSGFSNGSDDKNKKNSETREKHQGSVDIDNVDSVRKCIKLIERLIAVDSPCMYDEKMLIPQALRPSKRMCAIRGVYQAKLPLGWVATSVSVSQNHGKVENIPVSEKSGNLIDSVLHGDISSLGLNDNGPQHEEVNVDTDSHNDETIDMGLHDYDIDDSNHFTIGSININENRRIINNPRLRKNPQIPKNSEFRPVKFVAHGAWSHLLPALALSRTSSSPSDILAAITPLCSRNLTGIHSILLSRGSTIHPRIICWLGLYTHTVLTQGLHFPNDTSHIIFSGPSAANSVSSASGAMLHNVNQLSWEFTPDAAESRKIEDLLWWKYASVFAAGILLLFVVAASMLWIVNAYEKKRIDARRRAYVSGASIEDEMGDGPIYGLIYSIWRGIVVVSTWLWRKITCKSSYDDDDGENNIPFTFGGNPYLFEEGKRERKVREEILKRQLLSQGYSESDAVLMVKRERRKEKREQALYRQYLEPQQNNSNYSTGAYSARYRNPGMGVPGDNSVGGLMKRMQLKSALMRSREKLEALGLNEEADQYTTLLHAHHHKQKQKKVSKKEMKKMNMSGHDLGLKTDFDGIYMDNRLIEPSDVDVDVDSVGVDRELAKARKRLKKHVSQQQQQQSMMYVPPSGKKHLKSSLSSQQASNISIPSPVITNTGGIGVPSRSAIIPPPQGPITPVFPLFSHSGISSPALVGGGVHSQNTPKPSVLRNISHQSSNMSISGMGAYTSGKYMSVEEPDDNRDDDEDEDEDHDEDYEPFGMGYSEAESEGEEYLGQRGRSRGRW